jgi:hypothetical protein
MPKARADESRRSRKHPPPPRSDRRPLPRCAAMWERGFGASVLKPSPAMRERGTKPAGLVSEDNYIAAMRAARRLASGVAGSGAGAGGSIRLVERGKVQSHSSAPIW